jgi:hypothetical protein
MGGWRHAEHERAGANGAEQAFGEDGAFGFSHEVFPVHWHAKQMALVGIKICYGFSITKLTEAALRERAVAAWGMILPRCYC